MKKYLIVFHLGVQHALRNTKGLMGLCIFLLTCLIIFAHLWRAAAAKVGAAHLNPQELLWYIAFNQWLLVSIPDAQMEIEQDLRSGRLAYLLPRPISYLGSIFAEACGTLLVNLTLLGAVSFAFTWLCVGSLPFSPAAFGLALFLGLMAGAVGLIFRMIIGLLAFWLHEIEPVYWIWEKLLFMFGGLLIPLTIYPLWLQKIAAYTPFPALLGQRSALAIDPSSSAFLTVFLLLVVWGALGALLLLLLYRRGLRILNIGGG